jgi:hypothetical protein
MCFSPKQTPEFVGDEFEVASMWFLFNSSELLDDSRLIQTSIRASSPGVTMKNVPAFELEGKKLCGEQRA